ncbi:MAG TPA: lanthionine synthetase LanC family protein [Kofleriaceae bacterium]|jgi:hypothetical protein
MDALIEPVTGLVEALAAAALPADPSLGSGTVGALVALRVLGGDAAAAEARTIELLETTAVGASWFAGIAGIGAAFDVLGEREWCEQLDEPLAEFLEVATPLVPRYDLGDGWLGVARYFAARPPTALARRALARTIELMQAAAAPLGDGLAWREPDGRFDLGAAHGLAGAIDVLAELTAAQVPGAAELCAAAARALLGQRLGPAHDGPLPTHAGEPVPARLAWCYGDLGASLALVAAGDALGDASLRDVGFDAAGWAASLAPDGPAHRVVDAGLCHGAAGVGHLFQRLWYASKRDRFRDAARAWFERAVAMRTPGEGIGGFTAFEPSPPAPVAHDIADVSFLTGTAGIALALAGAAGDDRAFGAVRALL